MGTATAKPSNAIGCLIPTVLIVALAALVVLAH